MESVVEFYELVHMVTEDLLPGDSESEGISDNEKSKREEQWGLYN